MESIESLLWEKVNLTLPLQPRRGISRYALPFLGLKWRNESFWIAEIQSVHRSVSAVLCWWSVVLRHIPRTTEPSKGQFHSLTIDLISSNFPQRDTADSRASWPSQVLAPRVR